MKIFTPRLRALSIFVIAYMTIFLVTAIAIKNTEFIFYQVTMSIMIAIVLYMDKRCQFSPLVLWGLVSWGFIHLAGGLLPIPESWTILDATNPVLYDLKPASFLPKYDQIVHAFGFGICLIAAHEALQAHLKQALPLNFPIGATLLLIAMGLGAANEMIEFIAVISIPNTNVGGYENTGWDLVSNSVGAFLSLMFLKFKKS